MASDWRTDERDAALRSLLVERADAARPRRRRAGARPTAVDPGRVRMAVVTGAVLAAVIAVSAAVLSTTGSPSPVAPAGQSSSAPSPTPTRTPTPSRTSTPVASATPEAPLIAKRGAQVRTRAELHAAVQSDPILRGNAIWEEQAWIKIGCMAEQGFLYDPVAEMRGGEAASRDDGLTAQQEAAFEVAMYGPDTSGPYDWRTAGCNGLAVHETGQDHAN
ncbi:hypothetical protein [Amnibacterium endophyticum]|uniref:Uncharacterized protein n=1 Tax=Amnibacterium endophyticum TaxID=2109337 RepID=A0ABW4LA77_9MICO